LTSTVDISRAISEIGEPVGIPREIMNFFKTTILMAALTGLLLIIGQMVGGQNGMIFALVMAGAMNFFSYWFSDKIVLAMYRAKEVDRNSAPRLYSIVERLAQKVGMPMPRVYVIPTESPNAFATGRNPRHAAVAATSGILRILSNEELEGVFAHELGHVRNRDILISSIVATMAGAIMWIALMARWAAIFGRYGGGDDDDGGGNIIVFLLMVIIAPIAATIIQLAISRSREYAADAAGAEISSKPLSLASALRRLETGSEARPMDAKPASAHMFIVNPLRGGGVISLFRTHPPTEERIRRLEQIAYGR